MDQRLCVVPDGDLFKALKSGKASIETDRIETFTESGIRLMSGTELDADIVVTATGLKMEACGGMSLDVDGEPVSLGDRYVYKGMMISEVPNLAMCVGYTNALWTLRADLTSMYVCRLLTEMDKRGYSTCVPQVTEDMDQRPILDLESGYGDTGAEAAGRRSAHNRVPYGRSGLCGPASRARQDRAGAIARFWAVLQSRRRWGIRAARPPPVRPGPESLLCHWYCTIL